jgi:lyso-ornithine lipid O-acyltransferase
MPGLMLRLGRIAAYTALTLPLMPVQTVLVAAESRWARRLPVVYHRLCCRIMGFHIECHGTISAQRPTLFIVNHTSYLDIMILSAAMEASFVAKSEVARWPLFGWLARLQRTVFVDRNARRGVGAQRDSIRRRLATGDNLILFPEGTSSDGSRVLPFKSALFAAAEEGRVVVQPVSVAYVRLDGIPIGRFYRPFFAWYGDMDLAPHLWTALGLGQVTVSITFHPPVRFGDFGSRKLLAEHCWRQIATGVAAALAGRAVEADLPTRGETAAAAQ